MGVLLESAIHCVEEFVGRKFVAWQTNIRTDAAKKKADGT